MNPDYILVNGKFYTSNEAMPWAEAVAVKDSKFLSVGTWEELSPCTADCPVYNLEGRLVLPGMIDAHTHLGLSVMLGDDDDGFPMYHCQSKQEILDTLRAEVRAHPLRLYYAIFFGQAEALGNEGLTRTEIDEIVKLRPVILMEDECHSAWVNSAALKLMKYNKNTPDPAPGYSYLERDADGELTGCIKEMAMLPLLKICGNVSDKDMKTGMKKIMDYLVAHGITTVYDAGNYLKEENTYKLLKEMDEVGQLPVRVEGTHIINMPDLLPNAITCFKHLRDTYTTKNIKFKTIKMMLDGTQRIRTAKMITPYSGTDITGGTLIPQELLDQFVLDLDAEGIDFHLHTVGEGAVRMVMDAVEKARTVLGRPLTIRITCAHVEVLHRDDIDRFKELDIIANFTPHWHGGSCAADIPSMEKLLGKYRATNSLQAKTVFDTGAIVTFSSDEVSLHTLNRWSPFAGMEIGHTRQEINSGGKDAPIFPPVSERLTLEDLIKGYTINAAYQLRLEDQIGSIETGKAADMVILKENLFEMDPYEIHNILPEAVIMNGEKMINT